MHTHTKRVGGGLKQLTDQGRFTAVFATFNTIDRDGDVTLPGAFEEGARVRIAQWGHAWDRPAIGDGVIRTSSSEALVDGRIYLDTEAGREHFKVIKNLGDLQEWSYGFEILDYENGTLNGRKVRYLKKLKVHEVSPVLVGAGIGTHTQAIKSRASRISDADLKFRVRALQAHDADRRDYDLWLQARVQEMVISDVPRNPSSARELIELEFLKTHASFVDAIGRHNAKYSKAAQLRRVWRSQGYPEHMIKDMLMTELHVEAERLRALHSYLLHDQRQAYKLAHAALFAAP